MCKSKDARDLEKYTKKKNALFRTGKTLKLEKQLRFALRLSKITPNFLINGMDKDWEMMSGCRIKKRVFGDGRKINLKMKLL